MQLPGRRISRQWRKAYCVAVRTANVSSSYDADAVTVVSYMSLYSAG